MSEPIPTRVSYAQNSEDVRVWRALRGVTNPFYVEVGASHPFDDSLTAALSAEGWSGLLVEPEPSSAELLRQARPRDVVVAAGAHQRPGVLTWSDLGTRGRGTVDSVAGATRTVTVPAVRLSDLLDDLAPDAVHFMSVDVEGHEEQALAGLDLSRWRPWLLCIEATLPGSREKVFEGWEPRLLEADYRFVVFDGLNRWYVAQEHADLAEAVAEPYGVLDRMLDGWQRRDVVELETRIEQAQGVIAHLEKRSEAAAAALAHKLLAAETLATQRLEASRAADAALQSVKLELHRAGVERADALAREAVMLESKSWQLTSPLRATRKSLVQMLNELRRTAGPAPVPPASPAPPVSEGDRRRLEALGAKVEAARRRASR